MEDVEIELERNLLSSLEMLDQSPEVVELFGELFIKAYKAVKSQEFEDFNKVISSWEREFLLLNV